MIRAAIQGTGFFVPENIVTNEDLTRLMDTATPGSPNAAGSRNAAGCPWTKMAAPS